MRLPVRFWRTAWYLNEGLLMTDVHVSPPPALRRALDLLADPPADPDVSKGYLDLLSTARDETIPKNTGPIQAAWASPIGSMLYDNAQALSRRLINAWQHPVEWLNIPQGGTALDVGSGPGNITSSLARAAGPDGLALGVDISKPMLARAGIDGLAAGKGVVVPGRVNQLASAFFRVPPPELLLPVLSRGHPAMKRD